MPPSDHSPLPPRRIHIGHHFFGSGNLGDDLMLGGFLRRASMMMPGVTFTCCTPFDRASQMLRFPEVAWLSYEPAVRRRAIDECEAWLGVGDTPFQTDVGSWFLDHLREEVVMCDGARKPMFFVAVGMNNRQALDHPSTRIIAEAARHIWTRDPESARGLRVLLGEERVTVAADLAHLHLAAAVPAAVEPGTLAFLLNFEDRHAFTVDAIVDTMARTSHCRHLWLVQEVRVLPGSERDLYRQLPAAARARLDVRMPDYARSSMATLLRSWGNPHTLVTSRYHGALVGAWGGARTVVIERNDKLTGAVAQLGLASVAHLRSAGPLCDRLEEAQPSGRPALELLARTAEAAVDACLAVVARL